jgi:FtsP/CotA-like multicopper oxidase with cupredoxin domain
MGYEVNMNRRTFLALSSSCLVAPAAFASPIARPHINVETRILEVQGKAAKVYGLSVDGKAGGLYTRYGQDFTARVTNSLSDPTLIHWHGLTPPVAQDGVPGLSGSLMSAGETRDYSFANSRTGTHWMHSHVGLQEQQLLAAPLIVAENGAALVDEQEHVVMLHDFTFRDPQEILSELQSGGGLHAGHNMAASTEVDPHAGHNMAASKEVDPHAGHNMGTEKPAMQMASDVAFDAMLANDRTLADPEIVKAEKSGRFRLRIINGAAASNMWIESLQGELIAVDGNSIRPVRGNRFPLAIAQRADVRLALPQGSGAYPVYFTVEGSDMRSGIILQAGDATVSKSPERGDVATTLDISMEPYLRSIAELPDNPVSRTDIVMLTGGEQGYQWGFNGKPMMHETLLSVRQGERYEIIMHNMTTMAHPMHLHGHYFRVVDINGQRFKGAIRDTILVPPGDRVTIQFDADNPGNWAFHCHHLYHMNSGMMAAISYSDAA